MLCIRWTTTDDVIRPATFQDAGSIARVHVDAWKSAYHGIVPDSFLEEMNIEERTKRWTKNLTESRCETFVLESTGKVVGWISYGQSRDADCDGLKEIWALYVSPVTWRRGHGRALMNFAEQLARDSQTPGLLLWVLESNTQARSFYERIGYSPDGTTKSVEIGTALLKELRYRKKVEPGKREDFTSGPHTTN